MSAPFPAPAIVRCEPVSTIIGLTALLESTGAFAAAGLFSAGSIGGAIVSFAALGAFSVVGRAMAGGVPEFGQGGLSGRNAADNQELRFNTRQSIPPKRIVVGTCLVGGALCEEDVVAPYLYHQFLSCADEIAGFRELRIGTQQVALLKTGDYLPTNQILVPQGALSKAGKIISNPDYASYLRASFRVGTTDQQTDPLLVAGLGKDATFRQQGHASFVLEYKHGPDFDTHQKLWGNGGQPNPFVLLDGVKIPDPRDPTQTIFYDPLDPAAVAAAKATWKWSNCAALVEAWYLTQRFGGRFTPSQIDWDKVAAAADFDDELVGCKDGSFIRRYTIDGVIGLNQRPSDTMRDMLSANRSFVITGGGKVWVRGARPKTPVVTIHDKILTGAFEFRADKPTANLLNRVKVRFVSEDTDYNLGDGPLRKLSDAIIAADGEPLEGTLELPFTRDHRRAQRLSKIFLDASRLPRLITCRVDLRLLAETVEQLIGEVATVDSELFPQANGTYVMAPVSFAEDFSMLELVLAEYDGDIETDWDFATDEHGFSS